MLYAYTRNAARVLNEVDEIGSLTPGKRADLVLIGLDVLTVPVAELERAAAVWTMFGARLSQDKRRENGPNLRSPDERSVIG